MMVLRNIIRFLLRLRFIGGLKNTCFKPGHFYSPIISLNNIKTREVQIWEESSLNSLPDINLNSNEQITLLQEFKKYYSEQPFSSKKSINRYYFENIFFSYTDGILLYSVIRHFKPKQIIEVGSGFSSALMLDTAQHFLPDLRFSFIEPYPKRLKSLMTGADKENIKIIENTIQNVELSHFETLENNDILFIDSTHISKTDSDVNHILFKILPRLKKGVIIHFHDIFYPFEYPKEWVYQGRNWNESYILRAFLMNNKNYKIILFADYLHKHKKNSFDDLPLCNQNTGGSIWLEKF